MIIIISYYNNYYFYNYINIYLYYACRFNLMNMHVNLNV